MGWGTGLTSYVCWGNYEARHRRDIDAASPPSLPSTAIETLVEVERLMLEPARRPDFEAFGRARRAFEAARTRGAWRRP